MIMRQWRGRVPREKEQEYLSYLHGTGLEEYRSTPGNLGVFATTRPVGKAQQPSPGRYRALRGGPRGSRGTCLKA